MSESVLSKEDTKKFDAMYEYVIEGEIEMNKTSATQEKWIRKMVISRLKSEDIEVTEENIANYDRDKVFCKTEEPIKMLTFKKIGDEYILKQIEE